MDCGNPVLPRADGLARCITRSRTGTTSSIRATGRRRRAICIPPKQLPGNSPVASAPAPCEEACTLNLENAPVAIKTIEQAIADKAWDMGWIKPEPPTRLTGKRVAVIGSRPAGLAAAQQLARVGHEVHVFERQAKPRRAPALRHSGFQDGEVSKHRPARQADGSRGRHLPLRTSISACRRASRACTTNSTQC